MCMCVCLCVCCVIVLQVISFPHDYEMWCNTMFSLFGTKWCKIHAGSLWTRVAQDGTSEIVRTRNIVRQFMCTNVHQCVHVLIVLCCTCNSKNMPSSGLSLIHARSNIP